MYENNFTAWQFLCMQSLTYICNKQLNKVQIFDRKTKRVKLKLNKIISKLWMDKRTENWYEMVESKETSILRPTRMPWTSLRNLRNNSEGIKLMLYSSSHEAGSSPFDTGSMVGLWNSPQCSVVVAWIIEKQWPLFVNLQHRDGIWGRIFQCYVNFHPNCSHNFALTFQRLKFISVN